MELVLGTTFLEHVRSRATVAAADTLEVDVEAPTGRIAPGVDAAAPPPRGGSVALDIPRLRAALRQLVEGVQALHAAGKLHRDLKPSNVLVTPAGRVVILDFGLVAELGTADGGPGADGDAHSEERIVGTPGYMAPEQAAAGAVGPAADWYSVGVMLYEALAGALPIPGHSMRVLIEKQLRDPLPPSALAPGIPADLDALCAALLGRRPEARPSGPEIARRLAAAGGEAAGAGAAPPAAGEPAALVSPEAVRAVAVPLVGREPELAAIRDAFAATDRGRAVVLEVHGSSGLGKSALARHAIDELLRGDAAVVLAGRCYERESVPFKALDPVVDALCRHLLGLAPREAAAIMPRGIHALARLFPVLGRVPAVAQAPRGGAETPDPHELRRRAFAALRELLARIADRRPLVLFIDDLQWGDDDSAAVLADLLRPPDPPALLLIVAYRSEDAATSPPLRALLDRFARPDAAFERREVAVSLLRPDDARDLARALLAGGEGGAGDDDGEASDAGFLTPETADALARTIAAESGGNPFLVGELVRYVLGGVDPATGSFGLGDAAISVEVVLAARLGRLPAEARRLVEVVAVAGRPVPEAIVRRAAGLGPSDAAVPAVLRAARLIRTRHVRDEECIEAYHDRVRETIVATLAPAALAGWHGRLAEALEAAGAADREALAVHCQGAGDRAKAARYAVLAADDAAFALAFDHAASLYRLALSLGAAAGDGAAASGLGRKLGDALANAGRGAEAAAAYLDAAASAGASAAPAAGPAAALELRRLAAEQLLRSGHMDEGLAHTDAVLGAVGMRLARTPFRALASLLLGRLRLFLRGLGFVERDAARVPAEDLARVDICWSVAGGLALVDSIRSADFQTRHLLLALRAGEPFRIARGLALESAHSAAAGGRAGERTARLIAAAEALARRIDDPRALGLASLFAGIAAFLEGSWRRCRGLLERAEGLFRDRCTGVAWELANVNLFLGCLYWLGDLAEIGRRAGTLRAEAEARGDLFALTSAVTGLTCTAWLAADAPDEARRELDDVMGRWSSRRGLHLQHQFELYLRSQIDLYRGDGRAALAHVAERWPALERALIFRVQYSRINLTYLRARCALAAAAAGAMGGGARAATGPEREALLASAERDARALAGERMPWSDPIALLVRAGVAALRGDDAAAEAGLAGAVPGFEAAGMALHAAVARRARGALLGGDEGRALATGADAFLTGQSVRDPARFAAMIAPGLGGGG